MDPLACFFTGFYRPLGGVCSGLMVGAFDSVARGLSSSPGRDIVLCSGQDTFPSQCLSPPRCIYSLRHRKCGVRGFIHELFASKTRTSEVRASEGF